MIPCSYEESLSLAEETCFGYLREKLGLDPSAAFKLGKAISRNEARLQTDT